MQCQKNAIYGGLICVIFCLIFLLNDTPGSATFDWIVMFAFLLGAISIVEGIDYLRCYAMLPPIASTT